MTATELNPAGYITPICYKCTISPIGGLTPEVFTKQITITATPLDCSSSLAINPSFVNPNTFPFNSAGSSTMSIAADYKSIFTDTLNTDCLVTSCEMLNPDCSTALPAHPNIVFGASPTYGITASKIIPAGYSLNFCYKCTIGITATEITKDITITATPLDCSSSLTNILSYADPIIPYNSAGTSVLFIAAGYTDIFTHTM